MSPPSSAARRADFLSGRLAANAVVSGAQTVAVSARQPIDCDKSPVLKYAITSASRAAARDSGATTEFTLSDGSSLKELLRKLCRFITGRWHTTVVFSGAI